ncbi:hypothetical protein E2C01_033896 [Portunus trituberculatus]|uniref:Uncharacterized protein n=1 Tax=Portunus trituberculatus TaxID=210409 RepID=A0A5B7EZ40_PORTR|nr:hypothetical protein [Portunus trituberculatus]
MICSVGTVQVRRVCVKKSVCPVPRHQVLCVGLVSSITWLCFPCRSGSLYKGEGRVMPAIR